MCLRYLGKVPGVGVGCVFPSLSCMSEYLCSMSTSGFKL